mmetsp:Transcript_30232/g.49955  ORF Transcript_30232/g.49955 Transcript_30232/m.49955 type:complete len:177 (+) Transcript_30232:116-646(+)|eukprot:CAMPEP_0119004546 /NCGR_PEP_ID=MMETSP1176-20130426/1206_1 /TAXON_ID=265551 /ORGANISM="Synedropsis recta cf, Strain CCMP1620" /LENGTH=176 /DNA_ID=CAMNT_0006956263 /DNA_START=114 /DNA_END=644 /DNA_ORIENTATION=+
MSSEGLNAGASTFTPGGDDSAPMPPSDDSFRNYAEMIETIEAEVENTEVNDLSASMNNASVGGGPVMVDSSLPEHLAHKAAEFWFPECRDCTCCNGFKHACQCGGICKCSPTPVGSLKPAPPGPSSGRGGRGRGGGRGYGGGGGRGGGGRGGKVPCKFFQSSQGCRFGDQCRFAHE